MKAKFKENWKLITLTMAVVLALGYAVYYVNCIHIPALKAQRAEEVRLRQEAELAQQEAKKEPVVYDYTITPSVQIGTLESNTADQDKDDASTAQGNIAVNMASGGSTEDITGGTGIYLGDHPTSGTQYPNGSTPGQTGIPTDNTPGNNNTPSDDPADKEPSDSPSGNTPSGEDPSEDPSGDAPSDKKPSEDSSGDAPSNEEPSEDSTDKTPEDDDSGDKPKDGDVRYEDGQKQIYIDPFGWINSSGGQGSIIEFQGDNTEVCPNAKFG